MCCGLYLRLVAYLRSQHQRPCASLSSVYALVFTPLVDRRVPSFVGPTMTETQDFGVRFGAPIRADWR